ncbi:putative polysaccharide biosynthesis protein [Lentibacillus sediminis]|uniref:putative polysaccharide biosynthesis protein n=1 Tax=Lentibacillus sediminis TaxID=1940529 RepID=UPI000C1BB71A|nr:polysaccharide biosynthesis protein [Lentibacillus sediminis]
MGENESNRLVKGALLLTLAGLVSKVLSAGYRIPLQNLTGDVGFYIYQQVYPILGIALVLALYGFPQAISKMTADRKAEGKSLSFPHFYGPVLILLLGLNGAVFLFLWMNADSLAMWVGDAGLSRSYQFAAFVFLLIPFSALLRGLFQGNYEMKPAASSQVGEQLVRVAIIIAVAVWVGFQGQHLYIVGQAAALAAVAGAGAAIIILSLFLLKKRPPLQAKEQDAIPWVDYASTLITLGVVAALNHMVLLVIQFADAFTLVPSLMESGFSQLEAMEAKGVFDRGQPLIQLGTVLGSSFALALIPVISREKLNASPGTFYPYIRGGMLFSFYLAAGATVGLIAIFPEANTLLFQNDQGTGELQLLVVSILLCSLAITAASILQGLGYVKRTAGFILIALFAKWIGNQLLVLWWGITGGALATVLALLILCTCVLWELKRKLPELDFFRRLDWLTLGKALVAMLAAILLLEFLFLDQVSASRLGLLFYVLTVSVTGGVLYLFVLLKGWAFTEKELGMLPFSQFFIRIHNGRNHHHGKN